MIAAEEEGPERDRTRRVGEERAAASTYKRMRLTAILQAPEIQTMYSLNMPVSQLRTKMRQEFERHRYVNQIKTVDVLLFSSHQEFQVRHRSSAGHEYTGRGACANVCLGNAQLLEATVTRAKVLPHRRGAHGDAAQELHQRILAGMHLTQA